MKKLKKMKKLKSNKGITLIALIVTIIVLLILAGVSIAMLTGENGILKQVQNAKLVNIKGNIEEQVDLAFTAGQTKFLSEIARGKKASKVTGEEILEHFENELTPRENYEIEVTPEGEAGESGEIEITIHIAGTILSQYRQATNDTRGNYTTVIKYSGETGRLSYETRHLWGQETIRYGITFDANGGVFGDGTTSKVVAVLENAQITIPEEPTKSGYVVEGWYTERTGGTKLTSTDKATGEITYYAKWEEAQEEVEIPEGFTASGLENEKNPESGLVIYRKIGNDGTNISTYTATAADWKKNKTTIQENFDQFVWVPVTHGNMTKEDIILDLSNDSTYKAKTTDAEKEEYIKAQVNARCTATTNPTYPMAVTVDGTNYIGVLYGFSAGTNGVNVVPNSKWTPIAESSYREPGEVIYDASNSVLGATMQQEFNTMIRNVKEAGGFWVGRYEISGITNTSASSIKVNSTKNQSPVQKTTWYKMYTQERSYASQALGESTKVTSSMIWGSQWDQIMIWMKEITNGSSYYVLNSVGKGNYNVDNTVDGIAGQGKTGECTVSEVNQIYDLAGNQYEWTLETYSTGSRVRRGGDYGTNSSRANTAACRGYKFPDNSSTAVNGSRLTLY